MEDVCGVDRRWNLTLEEFQSEYYSMGKPVVIAGLYDKDFFQDLFSYDSLQVLLKEESFKVGPVPYSQIFGRDDDTKNIGFERYVELMRARDEELEGKEGEGLYIAQALSTAYGDKDQKAGLSATGNLASLIKGMYDYIPHIIEWKGSSAMWNYQFFLGSWGTGAPPHFHEQAFNIVFYGIKEWSIAPPLTGIYANRHSNAHFRDDHDLDIGWKRCQQYPGELVFLPKSWGHSTRNFGETVGFGVEFNGDTLFPDQGVDNQILSIVRADVRQSQYKKLVPEGFVRAYEYEQTRVQQNRKSGMSQRGQQGQQGQMPGQPDADTYMEVIDL